jgi:hypothetical protein
MKPVLKERTHDARKISTPLFQRVSRFQTGVLLVLALVPRFHAPTLLGFTGFTVQPCNFSYQST